MMDWETIVNGWNQPFITLILIFCSTFKSSVGLFSQNVWFVYIFNLVFTLWYIGVAKQIFTNKINLKADKYLNIKS